jgi:hypothetical protein
MLASDICASGLLDRRPVRNRSAFQHDDIVGAGQIENGAGAFVKHVGIEAFGPQQRYVTLDALPHLFEAGEFALQRFFALLKADAGVQPVLADLEVIEEIAAERAGEQRK